MFFQTVAYSVLLIVVIKFVLQVTAGRCTSNKCLLGKVAIVTGAAKGLGHEIATLLASRGCKLILADIIYPEESAKQIIQNTGNKNVTPVFIDLADFNATRNFCTDLIQTEDRLDILIHNAGCIGTNNQYTNDGFLNSLQVHHLGPFLMIHLLVGLLKKTKNSRVVFVSTSMIYFHKLPHTVDIGAAPNMRMQFLQAIVEYANSKVYSLIAANIFGEKLRKYGVIVTSVQPGEFYSDMVVSFKKYGGLFGFIDSKIMAGLYKFFTKTISIAAESVVEAAISADTIDAKLYWDCRPTFFPGITKNRNYCHEVWKQTVNCVKLLPHERLE